MMLKPKNLDEDIGRGIVVAKAVIITREVVPMRVINLNGYPFVLKKGTIDEHCSPVSLMI